jgi:hypothetical protein
MKGFITTTESYGFSPDLLWSVENRDAVDYVDLPISIFVKENREPWNFEPE